MKRGVELTDVSRTVKLYSSQSSSMQTARVHLQSINLPLQKHDLKPVTVLVGKQTVR